MNERREGRPRAALILPNVISAEFSSSGRAAMASATRSGKFGDGGVLLLVPFLGRSRK